MLTLGKYEDEVESGEGESLKKIGNTKSIDYYDRSYVDISLTLFLDKVSL